jgi:C1A family cysteine protease
MQAKEMRTLLSSAGASWTLAKEIDDKVDVDTLAEQFGLGALPEPPGAYTARYPRIRPELAGAVALFDPILPRWARPTRKALPKAWDWRNVKGKNWVWPARNQGGCGSCVAFGAAAAVEAHRRIETNRPDLSIDLSEAALFFANNRQCNAGDPSYGWFASAALDYLVTEGACFESNYPYRPVNQQAVIPNGTELTLKITGYDSTTNSAQMKRWLVEEGPLVTGYTVYQDFFTYWAAGTGVYTHTTGAVAGGHVVLCVGFDDARSCWICKNSWGTPTTHADGCFEIGYGQCGIDGRMYLVQDVYDVVTVDELPYDPRALRMVDEGARGWLLTDGRSRMKMFDNREDARNGLAVARRHTRHGFVGRDNPRPKRSTYLMEYWAGDSGLPYTPLTKTDCIPYDPNNVVATDLDAQGWRINEGRHWMLMAHDLNDALAMLRIVERHTRMCFIGRGNARPNRDSYIMTYFE